MRGSEHWSKNEDWQVGAIVALADGRRDHFLSYVANAGGSYRDGVRVEKLGQAVYEDAGLLEGKPEGMDREQMRDYVLKPLVDLGVVTEATWTRKSGQPTLLPGHLKAKSPNSVYRLADEVVEVLDAPTDPEFDRMLEELLASLPESRRRRLDIQRAVREAQPGQAHGRLVEACVSVLTRLAPGFVPVFVDVADGKRITDEYRRLLDEHGLSLELSDTLPDAILADGRARRVIGIEAVTSDGEFDSHRITRFEAWAQKHGYAVVAAVTAYPNYKVFAGRQTKNNNIAYDSYVWIMDRPDAIFFKRELGDAVAAAVG